MDMNILIPAVTTAVTVGLGCGTCCSPIISTFLSTYVVSHSDGVKKGGLSFISFFAGKLISVTFLCMVAAAVTFSLASMASPVLLLTVITGALSKKMRQEIPGCIKWFRLGSYLLLMVMPFIITI